MCTSGGRPAAATVMTTTFIPTRSGDGTFVLDFGHCQYTLILRRYSGYLSSPFLRQISPRFRHISLRPASATDHETSRSEVPK